MAGNVLIVDDELLIAMDIATVVEELGYTPILADNQNEALAQLDATPAPLGAVIDWHLKNDTAEAIVERLIEMHVPMVLCSGSMSTALSDRLGAMPTVSKPFLHDDLKEAIRAAFTPS